MKKIAWKEKRRCYLTPLQADTLTPNYLHVDKCVCGFWLPRVSGSNCLKKGFLKIAQHPFNMTGTDG